MKVALKKGEECDILILRKNVRRKTMYIQTERLVLRNARPADAKAYHKMWNTPSVQKFNVMNPPDMERAAAGAGRKRSHAVRDQGPDGPA